MISPYIIIGKAVSSISRFFNIGGGGTWSGEIALRANPNIYSHFFHQIKKGIILIAGTNGKTTTARMVVEILETAGIPRKKIVHNDTGANLFNGLISSLINKASWRGLLDIDYAIFEVDEAVLPQVALKLGSYQNELIILLLNLFRDQLDRYGEVDALADKWKKTLDKLPFKTTLILNADDPQIAYLGQGIRQKVKYFGLNKPDKYIQTMEHATDSIYCPRCGEKLAYKGIYYSHLGIWRCPACANKRPNVPSIEIDIPLPGLYNEYNALAAVSVGHALNIRQQQIENALKNFQPAFGRQEEFQIKHKKIKIFLSKNPAGFNVSLRTVLELKPKILIFVLNDRIPDGKDISWIYDVDFEMIPERIKIIVSGDRVYDMGLRMKYAYKTQKSSIRQAQDEQVKSQNNDPKLKIIENLHLAIDEGLKMISHDDTLYILPTYSAMLEVRKILTGRKIL